MRLCSLLFVLAAACGGKSKPATTPAPLEPTAVEAMPDDAEADDDAGQGDPKGAPPDEDRADPCGGGE
jgi:hypothetical protein